MYSSSRLMAQCIKKSMQKKSIMVFWQIYIGFFVIFFAYFESITSIVYKIK